MPFLRTTSRTVHHYREEEKQNENSCRTRTDEETTSSSSAATSLTVRRKSLLFDCNGFTVYGSDGSLVYRVDNYFGRPDNMVLMDGSGEPLFTICRPKMCLVRNWWLVYEGEVVRSCNKNVKKSPIFWARKKLNVTQTKLNVLAYVYSTIPSNFGGMFSSQERYKYVVEGSYVNRSCKILDESRRRVVAEIKKKEDTTGGGVSFGLDVFHLMVNPGFESRFAMAIVLLLDQMFC